MAIQSQYTEFCYIIRPTIDFLGQLQSHGDGIEVVSPPELRQKMNSLGDRYLSYSSLIPKHLSLRLRL